VEPVRGKDAVELVVLSGVVGDDGACSQHRLVTLELGRRPRVRRQRPQEPRQAARVARLLKGVAHLRHLLSGQPQQLLSNI